jgi:hypothetical protein
MGMRRGQPNGGYPMDDNPPMYARDRNQMPQQGGRDSPMRNPVNQSAQQLVEFEDENVDRSNGYSP